MLTHDECWKTMPASLSRRSPSCKTKRYCVLVSPAWQSHLVPEMKRRRGDVGHSCCQKFHCIVGQLG